MSPLSVSKRLDHDPSVIILRLLDQTDNYEQTVWSLIHSNSPPGFNLSYFYANVKMRLGSLDQTVGVTVSLAR